MNLDMRTPLGLMFLLAGALLTAFGLASRGTAIYAVCLGIDVNLCWGLVLLAFGGSMFLTARKGQKQTEKERPQARTGRR
jgi:hypothetical protein